MYLNSTFQCSDFIIIVGIQVQFILLWHFLYLISIVRDYSMWYQNIYIYCTVYMCILKSTVHYNTIILPDCGFVAYVPWGFPSVRCESCRGGKGKASLPCGCCSVYKSCSCGETLSHKTDTPHLHPGGEGTAAATLAMLPTMNNKYVGLTTVQYSTVLTFTACCYSMLIIIIIIMSLTLRWSVFVS